MLFQSLLAVAATLSSAFASEKAIAATSPQASSSISSNTLSATTVAGTQPTLSPVIPQHINTRAKSSLDLQQHGHLYFAQTNPGSLVTTGVAARLSMDYQYPTLVLDHALESYNSVSCDLQTLGITFRSQEYYDHVKLAWNETEELVVITSEKGCSSYTDGSHHTYFKAINLTFTDEKLFVTLKGEHLELETIIADAHLEFGQYSGATPSHQAHALSARDVRKSSASTTSTSTKTSSSTSLKASSSKSSTLSTSSKSSSTSRTSQSTSSRTSSSTLSTVTSSSSKLSTSTTTKLTSTSSIGSSSSSSTATSTSTLSTVNSASSTISPSTSPLTSSTVTSSSSNTSIFTSTSTLISSTVTSSSSSSSASMSPCGPLPSSIISALPAASCGPNFDQVLDDTLGYYAFDDSDSADTWAAIAPGASLDAFYDDPEDLASPPVNKRGALQRRKGISIHFTFVKAIKSAVASVKATVVNTIQQAVPVIKATAKFIAKVAVASVKLAVELVEGDPSITLSVPTEFHFDGLGDSPWGNAKLLHFWQQPAAVTDPNNAKIKEELAKEGPELLPDNLDDKTHIALYCVDCGFNGTFKVTGALGFNLKGLHNATLDAIADLDMTMGLGIDCLAIKKVKLAKKLFKTVGFPGFSIPNIVALGPFLTVEGEIDFEMKAIGQMLASQKIAFRNAKTHMDFINPSNSYSGGWKPTVTENVTVFGELSAGLVFDLPVGVNFGLDVLKGKYSKQVALVDSTSIELEAKVEFDLSAGASVNTTADTGDLSGSVSYNQDECYGVEWNLTLHNQLNFDVLGLKKNYKIFEVIVPIAEGCIGEEHAAGGASASGDISSTSPSVPACVSPANAVINGNWASGVLAPWYITYEDAQNSYALVAGENSGYALQETNNPDPSFSNPYSKFAIQQDITFCPNQTYSATFDFQWSTYQYDVYAYATVYFDDNTQAGLFGSRSTDANAIGQWEHVSSTFVANTAKGSIQLFTVACNYESMVEMFDNIVIAPAPSSKRLLMARQVSTTNSTDEILLDTTADGSDEDFDDTPDPDNLDTYNANGTLAAPPDDSDLDTTVASDDADIAADDASTYSFLDPVAVGALPNDTASDNSTNYFPALPGPDITYLNLVDVHGTFQLSAGADRNLYLEAVDTSSLSGLFAATDGVYGGDFQSRMFYYYPAEMTALNVSRFRLADETDFPVSGQLIALAGIGVADAGQQIYVAVTTMGAIYYLAACNIVGGSTKVFLVQDPVAGLSILQTAVASWTVTGGVVSSCYAMGLNAPSVVASV